ncbi:MAG: ABC transporter ATP-binding protein [Gammaproteobacteria bacterium]|nr:ABC transporter ATP-binding protein [Gammaproteobacteria bacterium]
MSSDIAIHAQKLSKSYHIYNKPRDRLFQSLLKGRKQLYREYWAAQDISFEITKGETVGILGRNGAGKSTLLKMICGTLTPTSGKLDVRGRITALLELGTGFNPEFTGRENAILTASILGIPYEEITAQMAYIEEFADIGDFIDQPVKTYSSGMVVRLGFAVAINVNPDIFIVDEALAVGDAAFSRKCYAKMRSIQENGTTILFVTHSITAIMEFCDRAMLLEEGKLIAQGQPKEIADKYQRLIFMPDKERPQYILELLKENNETPIHGDLLSTTNKHDQQQKGSFDPNMVPKSTQRYGEFGASILNPQIRDLLGNSVNILDRKTEYVFSYTVTTAQDIKNVLFGMLIKTNMGAELGGCLSAPINKAEPLIKQHSTIIVEFRFSCNLTPGYYFLNAGIVDTSGKYIHRVVDFMMFKVREEKNSIITGTVDFDIQGSFHVT